MLVHVRDYTKGHPRIEANNHPDPARRRRRDPQRDHPNDEEIFARYGFERAEPKMTVDSEAIFALAEHAEGHAEALEELTGAMATAWFDERLPSTLFLARGVGRPLWIGSDGTANSFSPRPATRSRCSSDATADAAQARGRRGHLLRVEDGHVSATERFRPDHSYVEETSSPPCGRRTRAAAACSVSPRSSAARLILDALRKIKIAFPVFLLAEELAVRA